MTTDNKLHLPFGCTKGLPEGVRVAWGARMIAPADLVWDRQGCEGGEEGGPERMLLLDWLGSGAGDAARAVCREQRIGVGANGSSQDVITLFEDAEGKIVGSPQGSHGYVYIAAWLKEHAA
jgi:hypothetical protein